MPHSPLLHRLTRIWRKAQKQLPNNSRTQWTRRRFIRMMALVSGSSVTATAIYQPRPVLSQSLSRIAIIGGGIAGLNAAYQLKKQGYTATVYEAKSRLGGRMYTRTGDFDSGLYLDFGGAFINSDQEDILTLVEEFNLSLFNRIEAATASPVPGTAYYFDGRKYSEAEIAELFLPLAQQIMVDSDLLDEDFEQYAPILDRLSVADYLDQHADKIPSPLVRVLMENVIRTEYGAEAFQSSALQLLFIFPTVEEGSVDVLGASDEAYMVSGGSSQVINSLTRALRGQIKTRQALTKLESQEKGFRLSFASGDTVEADYVILAIPFTTLRQVDLRVDLPPNLRQFINDVDLGQNDKLFARFQEKTWKRKGVFDEDFWTNFGYVTGWESTIRIPERKDGVLTFFYGGRDVNDFHSNSIRSLSQEALNSFDNIVPGIKEQTTNQFLRSSWSLDPYIKGSYTNFKPGQLSEFAEYLYIEAEDPEESQNVAVGNLVFAGEHLSDEFGGYMNGGAQTGRLAAAVVAQMIAP